MAEQGELSQVDQVEQPQVTEEPAAAEMTGPPGGWTDTADAEPHTAFTQQIADNVRSYKCTECILVAFVLYCIDFNGVCMCFSVIIVTIFFQSKADVEIETGVTFNKFLLVRYRSKVISGVIYLMDVMNLRIVANYSHYNYLVGILVDSRVLVPTVSMLGLSVLIMKWIYTT